MSWTLHLGDCLDRFWAKVNKEGDCWEWTASRSDDGYGLFRVGPRCMKAHRVSWALAGHELPPGMKVLHRCDNPPCVNPAHLFLGTDLDNARDRTAKGRGARGERVGRSKLREQDVAHIRAAVASGEKQNTLAAAYGVATSTIARIVTRERWA